MPSLEKAITIRLRMIDEISGNLTKTSNSLKKMGDSLTSVGQKMTAGITLPIVAAGTAMMKTFADFESVMAELGARTGATADEMQRMEKFAIEMGRTTSFSATEAAQALVELTSSGSSAAEAMEMLPQVLNLAAAGALELGQAADAVTDIMAQFQVGLADTQTVVDILTQAAGASSATVNDLIQAFANAGPVLNQFGLSVEDSAAAMAVLAENGIKGAEAGTQLKSMLLNMTRDTETVVGAWERLGVSMFDAQGNMRNIDDVFKDINVAMQGMSTEEQIRLSQDLAGSYGLVGFNALRASNGISDMQAAMLNAASAEEVAEARKKTLIGAVEQLGGAFETLSIVLGGMAEGPLVNLINGITLLVNEFSKWAEANPAMAQTLMIILAIVAAIGPLLVIVGQLLGAFVAIQTFMVAFPAIAAGFAAVFAVLLSPIGLFVAAVALATAAILGNWFGLRDALVGSVSAIVGAVSKVGDAFKFVGGAIAEGWSRMIQAAGTSLSMLGQIIWKSLSGLGSAMMDIGSAIIQGLIDGIKRKAVELLGFVFKLSQDLTNAIKRALGIASPSKVMMKMGQHVVEGFHKGIEGMGGIGVNVNGRPVNGSAPTLSASGAGGGGVVNNYYFTPAPGTSNQQGEEIYKYVTKRIADDAKRMGAKKRK